MITYNLDKRNDKPIYIYLYECIKNDILFGVLKPNEKLPSKRSLSKQLQVSLITIENAYNQLIIEGYIYSIEKKGFFVEKIETVNYKQDISENIEPVEKTITKNKANHFPFSTWSSLSRKVLSESNNLIPCPFKGDIHLRKAIQKHLKEFHNMDVSVSSIVLGAGSEYLYSLLIQYFDTNKVYGLEDPGHLNIAKIYNSLHAKYKYIDLDENGIDINQLTKSKANIVHISPAHHFPTGITMPLKRRLELLKWANENNAYIIEDDYDSEFRFTGKPIPPLYQLDNSNRVIYINTFSKSLGPSFRIAYLVLPKPLENDFENKLGFYHNTLSTLDQKVLAKFIEEKYFERHINRMRKFYKEIHNELMNKLINLKDRYDIKIIDSKAGLHFLIEYGYKVQDKEVENLLDTKYSIHTLSHYKNKPSSTSKLVISYSDIEKENIDEFVFYIEKLLKVIKKCE